MAEAEQSHRVNRENRELDLQGSAIDYARTGVANQFKIGIMGSVFGFVLGLVGTVGGLALCWIGRWEAGLSAFFVAISGSSWLIFVRSQRAESRTSPSHSTLPLIHSPVATRGACLKPERQASAASLCSTWRLALIHWQGLRAEELKFPEAGSWPRR